MTPNKALRTRRLLLAATALACVVAALFGVVMGSSSLTLADVFRALAGDETLPKAASSIVMQVRIPRVAAALLAGAALATSGCIIQTVLANPLASPNIIGVNAGAGLCVLLASSLLPAATAVLPFAAFAGAFLTSLIIFAVASRAGGSRIVIVLVGMALCTVFTAGMNTILIVDPDAYVGASTFLVGGLSGVRLMDIVWPAGLIAVGLVCAMLGTNALNVVMIGDSSAHSVGMNVNLVRLCMLAVAALLAGATVSFAGLLGFVGLIVPHAVRLVTGNDLRYLAPTSALAGATFVCVCDMVARTAFSPYEIPVGILMAFVGGPFFIWLVVRRKGRLDV